MSASGRRARALGAGADVALGHDEAEDESGEMVRQADMVGTRLDCAEEEACLWFIGSIFGSLGLRLSLFGYGISPSSMHQPA
jgi:hypothetical protein